VFKPDVSDHESVQGPLDLQFSLSRRQFVKTVIGGAVVSCRIVPASLLLASRATSASDSSPGPGWAPTPGVARFRIDGLPKVRGAKVYARDFHAWDMSGWPDQERVMYAVRTDRMDRAYAGLNLTMLPSDLRPLEVIDAARIDRDRVPLPSSSMDKPFFVHEGELAAYPGQPVALLIFESFKIYRHAKKLLQFNDSVVRYGEPRNHPDVKAYSPKALYVRNGASFDFVHQGADKNYVELALEQAREIRAEVRDSGWQVIGGEYQTQSMDPVFMEPEAGLAWYDPANAHLSVVLGTQSPDEDLETATAIIGASADGCVRASVTLVSCYPGGGFGGRDRSYFPAYLCVGALYAGGIPLRWALDRFEQFQVGLKRHQTRFDERIAVDERGRLQALDAQFVMNGGGRKNLSPYVAGLAAMSAWCGYEIPRAISTGKALDEPTLLGGSQRGFGGPQAFLAIETLLDRAARNLKVDPFTIRRRNLAARGGVTITGAPIEQDLHLQQILDHAERHEVWQQRHAAAQAYEAQGLRYGVGFALSNQAYGTSGDGSFGAVTMREDGSLEVATDYVDMGNGSATALGLAPSEWLGVNAASIRMGEAAYFDALCLQKKDRSMPNYVIKVSGSSSACLGAFYKYQAVAEAARVLWLHSIAPAARALWGRDGLLPGDLRWRDGQLHAADLPALGIASIAAEIHRRDLPVAAAVHASFVSRFVSADFVLGGETHTLPLDFIALGRAGSGLESLARRNIVYPPSEASRFGRTTYAPCGSLAGVVVDPGSGHVQVTDMLSVLVAGRQICPEIVSGQSQGGVAMAIGYTLLEDCPNDASGPGNGRWNLNRYQVPRLTDIPRNQELVVLPPSADETTARGIAEAVMCAIPPAILNALAMATGEDFRRLPVTPDDVRGSFK